MGSRKLMIGVTIMALLSTAILVSSTIECSAVTALVSTCYTFITYGSPDPFPGSPCCNAMANLKVIADTIENRRFACRCLLGLISTYNPNAYAIATLPDFCQVSLGFNIDPNTDCNFDEIMLRGSIQPSNVKKFVDEIVVKDPLTITPHYSLIVFFRPMSMVLVCDGAESYEFGYATLTGVGSGKLAKWKTK